MKTLTELRKNLKKDRAGLKPVKLAVLGDTSTQLLVQAIQGLGYDRGVNVEVWEADYDQIDRQIFDASSDLYRFHPDVILIFSSTWKLKERFSACPGDEKFSFAQKHLDHLAVLAEKLFAQTGGRVLSFNYPEINDGVFGHYANKQESSFIYQLRRINLGLMDMARKFNNFFPIDLCSLQSDYGENFMTDRKMLFTTGAVFSVDFMPVAAKAVVDVLMPILGDVRKCVILDLDNTVWGGIIGEDGLENIQIGDLGVGKIFTEFQVWLRALRERGIILAVCSKNDESAAKEPFEKHPDMVLKLDDIAVFVANWENKADNIRRIQRVLNIGFDAMVFLDDSPFERNMVRAGIPEVLVPELPEDPAEYLPYLRRLNLFETAAVTDEDADRTRQYREEARREEVREKSVGEEDFLAGLGMRAGIKPFDRFNIPRVAQLTQRSNQFNLRTVRYTESDLIALAARPDVVTLAFSLEDRFGSYGLISAVILRKEDEAFIIDTWVMSCRVLKRGVEVFILNAVMAAARERGASEVRGEYIPTAKNGLVKGLYRELGFLPDPAGADLWRCSLGSYEAGKTWISVQM